MTRFWRCGSFGRWSHQPSCHYRCRQFPRFLVAFTGHQIQLASSHIHSANLRKRWNAALSSIEASSTTFSLRILVLHSLHVQLIRLSLLVRRPILSLGCVWHRSAWVMRRMWLVRGSRSSGGSAHSRGSADGSLLGGCRVGWLRVWHDWWLLRLFGVEWLVFWRTRVCGNVVFRSGNRYVLVKQRSWKYILPRKKAPPHLRQCGGTTSAPLKLLLQVLNSVMYY